MQHCTLSNLLGEDKGKLKCISTFVSWAQTLFINDLNYICKKTKMLLFFFFIFFQQYQQITELGHQGKQQKSQKHKNFQITSIIIIQFKYELADSREHSKNIKNVKKSSMNFWLTWTLGAPRAGWEFEFSPSEDSAKTSEVSHLQSNRTSSAESMIPQNKHSKHGVK